MKKDRTRITILLTSLATSDGIMALVGGPTFTINAFRHRWSFGEKGRELKVKRFLIIAAPATTI